VIKGYVRNSKERSLPGQLSKVVIECDPHPENAMVWSTREEAKQACQVFASLDLSGDGCDCHRFRVEEMSSAQFVVACDCAPPGCPTS